MPETSLGPTPPAGPEPVRRRLAVVVVHYHAADLALRAIDAILADAARSRIVVEGVVVDNGSDERERALLARSPFALVDPRANLGFAGGVNLGVERTSAPTVVVMNPDVEVLPGCLAALVDAVEDRCAVAGPRFFWDHGRRFLLPPTEVRSRRDEVLGVLAERTPWAARWARRRWRRHARRHWLAEAPLRSFALSGGLLAITRSAWRRVGPFDTGYRLYFEETDWLRRARRSGVEACYVPAAQAIHLHGRSAAAEPRAAAWFAESAERYRRQAYGRLFSRLLRSLAALWPPFEPAEPPPAPRGVSGYHSPVWIEASPNAAGYPAASELVLAGEDWRFPREIEERLAGERLTGRAVDQAGRELGIVDLGRAPAARDARVRAAV